MIYDLVGNCARHGLSEDWSATTVVGPATEIIRDPYIDKLADLPHRTAMAWAGKNIHRLVLVQRAKGHKDGWTFHAIQSFDPVAADQWWAARGKSSRPSGNENNGPPATGPPKEKPG